MVDQQPNQGLMPPDLESPVGQVRLLVGDTNPTPIQGQDGLGTYFWFSDDELTALLSIKGSVESTAIYVLRMIAVTPAMQLKKWSSADLSVDGAAITNSLRALIKDIEAGVIAAGDLEGRDVFQIVATGPVVGQPALYPHHVPTFRGQPIDPTLPLVDEVYPGVI
jgi:hypothetical protein